MDRSALPHDAAELIVMTAAISGCAVQCEPAGQILWSGRLPSHHEQVGEMVDGAMGGVNCEVMWQ